MRLKIFLRINLFILYFILNPKIEAKELKYKYIIALFKKQKGCGHMIMAKQQLFNKIKKSFEEDKNCKKFMNETKFIFGKKNNNRLKSSDNETLPEIVNEYPDSFSIYLIEKNNSYSIIATNANSTKYSECLFNEQNCEEFMNEIRNDLCSVKENKRNKGMKNKNKTEDKEENKEDKEENKEDKETDEKVDQSSDIEKEETDKNDKEEAEKDEVDKLKDKS